MRARFDAKGDVIVVTGGANGIGRALARAAAQAGARVIVCDVDAAAMAPLSDVAGISTRHLDVSDRAAVFDVLGGVERDFGKIDGLVCAAAIQPRLPVHAMEPAAWDRVLRINLDGVVWCYQAVVAGMIARRSGSIIAFTSGLANQGWPEASAYAASKAALIAFRQKRGQGDCAASRAVQSRGAGRDRHAAISRRQCRRRRCPLARIGRRRTARGCNRPAAVLVVR
jgi:2-hydroxycyclohexanecarboxyl-CoA dehydrogenase